MANNLKVSITGDGRQLNSELAKTADQMAKIEMQTKKANRQMQQMQKEASLAQKKLNDGFRNSANTIGMFSKGLSSMNLNKAASGFSQIGSAASGALPAIQSLNASMLANPYLLAGVAIVGAGKALFDYNVELDKTLQKTGQITGLSGDELMSLRNGIKSVADTFGKDFNDTLSAVDTLMSQFNINGEEALNIIRDGFVGGADDAGNMYELISKYAGAFNDAGISASELVAIIGNTRSGIFDENGMELISKGATKIREFGSGLQDSLNAVGINADEMYRKLQSGEMSTVQALQSISTKLKGLSPQSKEVGDVLSSVFGKQGAKAGYELVTALADVETDLSKVKEQTGEWGEAMEDLQTADREFENALSSLFGVADGGFSTMTTRLKADVYGAVAKVINGFIDWYNKSIIVRGAVVGLGTAFKNAWEIIKTILKVFMNSVEALSGMIEGVLTLDWNKVKNSWKNGMSNILKNIATGFENIKDNMSNAVDQTLNGEIKKIEVKTEITPTSTGGGGGGGGGNGNSNGTGGKNKSAKKDKKEVVKTQIELDREALQKVEKELKQAIDDFNNGLISKNELESAIKTANQYFKDNNIKANVELEYNTDDWGFEKASLMTKPIEIKSDLDIKRETYNKLKREIDQNISDFNIDLIDKTELEKNINEINELLKEIGAEPFVIKFEAEGVEAVKESIQIYRDALEAKQKAEERANEIAEKSQQAYSNLGSIFSGLGNAVGNVTGKFIELAGQTIATIGQMIPEIQSLIAAKQAEAIASGSAEGAKQPFPANIAAITSIVALLTSLFASFSGSFASGGIIGGNTTVGDFNIARVNKGEMILNSRQQGKLFNMLNGNGYYSFDEAMEHTVHFNISGTNLVGTLNNFFKKMNKVK